jgi:hypothetical protein
MVALLKSGSLRAESSAAVAPANAALASWLTVAGYSVRYSASTSSPCDFLCQNELWYLFPQRVSCLGP